MIKYKTGRYYNSITMVAVTKETEHFYTLENGRREKKKSDYQNYFDTKAEAKEYLVNRAQCALENCHRRTRNAEKYLAAAKAIKID